MSENRYKKKEIHIDVPILFPPLSKKIFNLDKHLKDKTTMKLIGEYSIHLRNQQEKSIYKKLLIDNKNKDSLNAFTPKEIKEIRSKYLKKLVESNPFFFPRELGQDEYKKPSISKEEKLKKIMKGLEHIANKEKYNLDLSSRRESNFLNMSRKDSEFEDMRKRKESMENDIGKEKNGERRGNENKREKGEDEKNNKDNNKVDEEEFEEENPYVDESYVNGSDNGDSQNNYDDYEGDIDEGDEY